MSRMLRSRTFQKLALTIAASLGIVAGAAGMAGAQTMVRDHSSNSIITGGTVTTAEFTRKARANAPGDLQAVYSAYGLDPSDYDRFQQTAKMGVAHKNGDITVDGKVVARETHSLGRSSKSYATKKTINGKPYYESRSQDVFASQSIPVMVMLDDEGRFEAGILTACANPVRATPVGTAAAAQYSCDMLRRTAVSGQDDTYAFSTTARASSGARITRVVYDFGDGSPTVERTDPADQVRHTYRRAGTYTARVTVYVDTAGRTGIAVTGASCVATVRVAGQPAATTRPVSHRCESLTARRTADTTSTTTTEPDGTTSTTDANGLRYTFTARASYQNARLSHVDFDFGDGNVARGVRPMSTVGSRTTTGTTSGTGSTSAPAVDDRPEVDDAELEADGDDLGTLPDDDNGVAVDDGEIEADSDDIGTLPDDDAGNTGTGSTGTTNRNSTTYTSETDAVDETGTTRSRTTATSSAGTDRNSVTRVEQTHTYARPGTYTARATLHFVTVDANGTRTNHVETCEVRVTTPQPAVTPVAATTTPPAPTVLPETGLTAILALFVVVSLIGSAGYSLYARRHLV